ncbi:hypothetical protein EBR43_05300 [bacterium]|nr:hypothetical protein [bacterium]
MPNLVNYSQSPFNKSRKDKFLLVLNFPDGLKDISRKVDRSNSFILPDSIQFSVYGALVPDVEVPALDIRYGGQTLATSSLTRPSYPPVTVNFTVDNRFNNYWAIYKWLNILNDSRSGTYDPDNILPKLQDNKKDLLVYAANISIFALDEYDKRTIEFKYVNAFPTALGGISFNNRDPGEIETSFTFKYSQFLVSLVESIDSL